MSASDAFPQSKDIPWLQVHPDDRDIPDFLYTNPDEFKPTPNSLYGSTICVEWGINQGDRDYSAEELRRRVAATMSKQSLYMGLVTPEKQYISILMKKKSDLLKQLLPKHEHLFGHDFILRIELVFMEEEIRPLYPIPVWRKIRVPGGITLNRLNDMIRAAMGWAKDYHGYIFTDPKDGAMFGKENSFAIDMMHLPLYGWGYLNDLETKVSQLITSIGEFLLYDYDLGDHFMHRIIVEEIIGPTQSNGSMQLLDGAGACPPEDSNGLPVKGNHGFQILCSWPSDSKEFIEACAIATRTSLNYQGGNSREIFSPDRFDLQRRQRAVLAAARGEDFAPECKVCGNYESLSVCTRCRKVQCYMLFKRLM